MQQELQQDFRIMNDDQATHIARQVILTSSSTEEVKRRLEEMHFNTDEILITACKVPSSCDAGVHAHSPFGFIGGLKLRDGTLITALIRGHQRPTILL